MKVYILLILAFISLNQPKAQTISDAGRLVLNTFVIDPGNKLSEEVKGTLHSKLSQIATENGIGGNSITPQFVIAAKLNIQSKDIVAGPPQIVALNTEVVFFLGNVVENKLFSSISFTVKAVGTNETKALINGLTNINPKNNQFRELITKGKSKIVEYYSSRCDLMFQKVLSLESQQKYDEAIYELMQVPDICKTCYDKSAEAVIPLFQKKINKYCVITLTEAKTKWYANPNGAGAAEAGKLISTINPDAECYKEVISFAEIIREKVKADEKRDWDFTLKVHNDTNEQQLQIINAVKEIAINYYKKQPKTIIYSNILW